MKKAVLILVALFTATTIFAQSEKPYYGFKLGLTAHPTFGFIKPQKGKNDGISLGFSYGLIGDFNFAENYSFSTGLTVTTINGKSVEINSAHYHAAGDPNSLSYNIKYKMQYIEIPLTIKLKTNQFGDVRWYGQFGLSTDFAIGRKQNAEQGTTVLANNVDASEWTNFFRAGMIIGGGLEYSLGDKTSVVTGLSLNNGLTSIVTGNSGTGTSVRNHYVGLHLGVFF